MHQKSMYSNVCDGTLLTQLNMPLQKYCMLENYTMSNEFLIHRASQESYALACKMRTLDLS